MESENHIKAIATDAPLSEQQTAWLGGYFAGMQDAMNTMGTTVQTTRDTLHILFGSQTGNAEAFAHALAQATDGECLDMVDVSADDMVSFKHVILITSTYGDGEHPDNGQVLWDSVQNIEKLSCHYAVIGLGDTAYDFFCKSAEDWEQFYEGRGAKRLLDTVKLDVDFEDAQDAIIATTKQAFDAVRGNNTTNASPENNSLDVAVLFGSQTGNAENFARDMGESLGIDVYDMGDVNVSDFTAYKNMILITSTYGDGEHPDNGQILWDSVQDINSVSCNYAVIGLGDTAYDLFCQSATDWDTFLHTKGGNRLQDVITLDVDFEDSQADIIAKTKHVFGAAGMVAPKTPDTPQTAKPHTSIYTRTNPYMGTFLTNTLLSSPESSKRVFHFEFEVDHPEMAYEAGDALGIIPINSDALVAHVIDAGGFDGNMDIDGESLSHILKTQKEIRLPNRDFIAVVAQNSQDTNLNALLKDKPKMDDWIWGRETVDILRNYDHKLDEQGFLDTLKPLQHRLYSISSSPKAHPKHVHLTVSAVEYDFNGRPCQGVASCFLAERLAIGDTVGLFIHANKAFSVPENTDTPIIMIGPGTGIAPFKAFLEDRIATNASGENWLFFGDRNQADDFLYRDTLKQWEQDGKVRLSLAWSRDADTPKTYVQDLMKRQGDDIFRALEHGAYFYVCGDASRMAKDVDAALLEIISTYGAMSIEKAITYVQDLKKNKRYVRDVY